MTQRCIVALVVHWWCSLLCDKWVSGMRRQNATMVCHLQRQKLRSLEACIQGTGGRMSKCSVAG